MAIALWLWLWSSESTFRQTPIHRICITTICMGENTLSDCVKSRVNHCIEQNKNQRAVASTDNRKQGMDEWPVEYDEQV